MGHEQHSSLFEKKRLGDFSKKVRDVFNLLTISRSYQVIGSGGMKSVKYNADYDLNEMFEKSGLMSKEKILDKITQIFQQKFVEAENDPNDFITDFKVGMNENGDALRWKKEDMKNGYKILISGRHIRFQDCILMKSTLKMDLISLIDGVFTEFSDNYLIKLGNNPDDANFFPHDLTREHMLNSIRHSYDEYFYASHNYFKGLKRCFSFFLMDGEDKHLGKLKSLLTFFNSSAGLLYKLGSEIDTIILIMENTFRKPQEKDLKGNIKIILDGVDSTDEATGSLKYLNLAMKARSANGMKENLEKSKKIIKDTLDKKTLDFISKNKNVLLY